MTDKAIRAQMPPDTMSLPRPTWLLAKPIALLMRDHRPFYGSALRMASNVSIRTMSLTLTTGSSPGDTIFHPHSMICADRSDTRFKADVGTARASVWLT